MEGRECKMIYYCQTFILKSRLISEAEVFSQSLARLMGEHKQQQLTQHLGEMFAYQIIILQSQTVSLAPAATATPASQHAVTGQARTFKGQSAARRSVL